MKRLVMLLIVALVSASNPHRSRGDEPAVETLLESKPVAEEGAGIARLKQERYNSALRGLQSQSELWRGGKSTLTDYIAAANRLLQAELDTSKKRLLTHHRFAQTLERDIDEKAKGGLVNRAEIELARHHCIELEIRLLAK